LPVPDGPHTTRFSARLTHSRVRSACWVGAGIEDASGVHASKVLPVGKRGRGAAGGQCGAFPPGGLGGEEGFEDFHRFPPLSTGGRDDLGGVGADVRQPQPAQQRLKVLRQGRGHGDTSDGDVGVTVGCTGAHRVASASVVPVVVGAPRAAQPAVPWVSERSSPAWLAGPFAVAVWWWSKIEARSPCANRAWTAAWPNAQSTSLGANSFAKATASPS
jgi:hypothetical protein